MMSYAMRIIFVTNHALKVTYLRKIIFNSWNQICWFTSVNIQGDFVKYDVNTGDTNIFFKKTKNTF